MSLLTINGAEYVDVDTFWRITGKLHAERDRLAAALDESQHEYADCMRDFEMMANKATDYKEERDAAQAEVARVKALCHEAARYMERIGRDIRHSVVDFPNYADGGPCRVVVEPVAVGESLLVLAARLGDNSRRREDGRAAMDTPDQQDEHFMAHYCPEVEE